MAVIRAGDVLSIKEGNAMDSSKEEVKTYKVEYIPKHKRFITCRLFVKGKHTAVTCSFTELELRERLVQIEKEKLCINCLYCCEKSKGKKGAEMGKCILKNDKGFLYIQRTKCKRFKEA